MTNNDDDLQEFAEVADILRLGPSDVADERPSMALWNSIEAQLNPAAEAAGGGLLRSTEAEVTSLEGRRRRRGSEFSAVIVGIAAALLLVALPLGLAYRSSNSGPDVSTELAALEGFDGSGIAELDGRQLTVDTSGLGEGEDFFYELWLLDIDNGDLNDLRSIGVIEADGTYVIDEGIDLAEFNVVDISLEPMDGNPDHSGDSVLRGELDL